MGRIDDVINISGHSLEPQRLESAPVSHEAVAEAAVVGFPHEIKGEAIYAYVTLKDGKQPSDELKKILIGHVRTVIGRMQPLINYNFLKDCQRQEAAR